MKAICLNKTCKKKKEETYSSSNDTISLEWTFLVHVFMQIQNFKIWLLCLSASQHVPAAKVMYTEGQFFQNTLQAQFFFHDNREGM